MELERLKTATRWAAAALTCAIVADLAEDLIDPANSGSATKVYAAASLHHGRLIASAFLVLATAVFIVPGVCGLARLVDDRGRRFGRLAATLALLGALGHAALAAVYLVWAAIPSSGMSRTDLVELIDRINGSGWLAAFAPLFFAFPLSLVALFVALSRARIAPTWILAPGLAAPVVATAGQSHGTASTAAALVLLLVAQAGVVSRIYGGRRAESPPRLTRERSALA